MLDIYSALQAIKGDMNANLSKRQEMSPYPSQIGSTSKEILSNIDVIVIV